MRTFFLATETSAPPASDCISLFYSLFDCFFSLLYSLMISLSVRSSTFLYTPSFTRMLSSPYRRMSRTNMKTAISMMSTKKMEM